ncbi:Zn-ribbon domain-containing OB-fold protein [Bosea sp. (in: a-proteobacteria)]|uniref:Zn-ribbon domain-containing OB-fold protein n=1 Tax=Bosea sp. (in: a-proteobacteria) TaxID=1871050 RepID=UPI00261285D3|nr:Zn-ribbon domain-containing OB-fold protein [Bosea sp. (in: a-proteobacteria)]MCO5089573.1 Zn-ribbon domain-containing OB-fold protein [Bosea sp. (in: a-proteobacteria)]MCO5089584.1 Zn-ribbon domain-containing OB-fold protein [Bosea sp. (in: a-proteobacteria)]
MTAQQDIPAKPLPAISDFNRPFWEGTRVNEFRMQRCNHCKKLWAPNGPVCPHCFSDDYHWEKLSGKGKIASWVVFHKLYHKAFANEIPYNVAFVELEEGPRVIANIVGVDNKDIRIGMPVEAVFEKINEIVTVPKFKPR